MRSQLICPKSYHRHSLYVFIVIFGEFRLLSFLPLSWTKIYLVVIRWYVQSPKSSSSGSNYSWTTQLPLRRNTNRTLIETTKPTLPNIWDPSIIHTSSSGRSPLTSSWSNTRSWIPPPQPINLRGFARHEYISFSTLQIWETKIYGFCKLNLMWGCFTNII